MPRSRPVGHVALVGAGPGDPELLTRRGHHLLWRAEVVLYDRLVDPRLLECCRESCRREYVGKETPGRASRDRQQKRINALMVREARRGKRVVRLKGGDPFIFGRGGEEAEVLAKAGIPFEVVPGVTAALGASATAGIPFTHRGIAQEVTFATGHGAPGSSVDWRSLGRLRGTLVFYMGTYILAEAARKLIRAGRSASTPVAIVESATTLRQRTITGTLRDIAALAAKAGIRPPSLVIVGDVVRLRSKLRWFENRPLFGKRVLDLRTSPDPEGRLAQLGVEVTHEPGMGFRSLGPNRAMYGALRKLESFDWVVFTSPQGVVSAESSLLWGVHRDVRAFAGVRVAAIGAKTAETLKRRLRISADLVPKAERAEGLAAELRKRGIRGKRVLLLRAKEGRDILPQMLKSAGARVTDVAAYKHLKTKPADSVVADLATGRFDAVIVSSGEIARNLKSWLHGRPWPERMKLVTIGPVTSAEARSLGWTVDRESPEPGMLVQTTIEALLK